MFMNVLSHLEIEEAEAPNKSHDSDKEFLTDRLLTEISTNQVQPYRHK